MLPCLWVCVWVEGGLETFTWGRAQGMGFRTGLVWTWSCTSTYFRDIILFTLTKKTHQKNWDGILTLPSAAGPGIYANAMAPFKCPYQLSWLISPPPSNDIVAFKCQFGLITCLPRFWRMRIHSHLAMSCQNALHKASWQNQFTIVSCF